MLREGQLILAGKGNRHFAWAYRTAAGPCIASSLLYMLTVRTERVDPRYLALVLNSASCGRALTEIAENDYNLNIPRYVDTFEPEEPVDVAGTQVRIEELKAELVVGVEELAGYLKQLGF